MRSWTEGKGVGSQPSCLYFRGTWLISIRYDQPASTAPQRMPPVEIGNVLAFMNSLIIKDSQWR